MQVRDVENFPAELQALAFRRQLPALVQGHVERSKAISANDISRTGLSWIGVRKIVKGCHRIDESTDRTGRDVTPHLRASDHLADALFVPIGRPEITVVHAEWVSARPACYSGELPAPDKSVGYRTDVPSESAPFPDRQFRDPVQIELMRRIEVGDCAPCIGGEGIPQPVSR